MADNFRGLTTGATLGRELPFSQEAEELFWEEFFVILRCFRRSLRY